MHAGGGGGWGGGVNGIAGRDADGRDDGTQWHAMARNGTTDRIQSAAYRLIGPDGVHVELPARRRALSPHVTLQHERREDRDQDASLAESDERVEGARVRNVLLEMRQRLLHLPTYEPSANLPPGAGEVPSLCGDEKRVQCSCTLHVRECQRV